MKRDCRCPRVDHRHGTRRAYDSDGCRCLPCRAAHARSAGVYRRGGRWVENDWVDSAGTRRRLQALAAVGVTARRVAEVTGLSPDMVTYLRRAKHPKVTPALADLVTAAYEQLWANTPTTVNERRCATIAVAQGYLPPLAWDDDTIDDPAAAPNLVGDHDDDLDEVAVERIMAGTLTTARYANSAERIEAIRRLAAHGNGDTLIADRLGMHRNAIGKARQRHGIPAGRDLTPAGAA